MKGKFEVKVATNGKYYFVLKARNGATLAQRDVSIESELFARD